MSAKFAFQSGKWGAGAMLLFALIHPTPTASGQGSAFTYQGRLTDAGSAANGLYDLRCIIYNAGVGGSEVGPVLTNSATVVSNGLFTATMDFGAGIFTGTNYWLDIAVRTNGNGTFTELGSRQQLTPTPYALFAQGANAAGLTGTVPMGSLNGTYGGALILTNAGNRFSGDGGGLTNVNSTTVGGVAAGNLWQLGGNTVANGQFLGSTNYQPLELVVNGQRALRLEPNTNAAPNVIGGASVNSVSTNPNGPTVGATIAGGGGVGTDFFGNAIATANRVTGNFGTVSGGGGNVASGFWATVPGGYSNIASGASSFAAGGNAQAVGHNSFVWSDAGPPFYGPPFASTANGQFAVRAYGGVLLAADVQIGINTADYHALALGGGNSEGYLYGSYPRFGDGIHLSYNYYADNAGGDHVIASDGATSRITAGYGEIVLAVGGVNTAPSTVMLHVTTSGVCVNGTVNNCSDRNVKQDFMAISPSQILDGVLQLPVSEWSYKTDTATRHIGPVAQDFYSTFNIGTDDKHIAPIDEGGVALAAIQGLNEKVEEQRAELVEKRAEIAALKQRLDALEKFVLNEKQD